MTTPDLVCNGHSYYRVDIPVNNEFLTNWHHWVHGKVSRHFKRDKERIVDAVQAVRLRLLSKEFIERWFLKHLRDEFITRDQAEAMLGCSLAKMSGSNSRPIPYLGEIRTLKQGLDTSLWKVDDLLSYASYDHARYFYSPQGYTVDSDTALWLMGYSAGEYQKLKSAFRRGCILPAEFTEHCCVAPRSVLPKTHILANDGKRKRVNVESPCPECRRGKESLRLRGLSLASKDKWEDPIVSSAVKKLRWNDKQFTCFLRGWNDTNMIKCIPRYVMRPSPDDKIIAGLLKYASLVIDHEVVNEFKRLSKTDDLHMTVFNNGASPDEDYKAFEPDDSEDHPELTFRDPYAQSDFVDQEYRHDLLNLVAGCIFSADEEDVLEHVDFGDMSVREYADTHGLSIPRVHRLRNSVIRKLRECVQSDTVAGL
jgi:DNA-directed RNA polymerase specialized sigma24 family protein